MSFKLGNLENITFNGEEYQVCNKKHLNGYLYDSLCYRYIRAREHIAELEWERDHQRDKSWYFKQANRDIMRFCQILHEAIGEHD